MIAHLKDFKNKHLSFISKYQLYKAINPILSKLFSGSLLQKFLSDFFLKKEMQYLNLGGYFPQEGYVAVHLSPVEIYGIPQIRHESVSLDYQEETGNIRQKPRKLTEPTISLHYNILNGLPFASNSLKGINMSHILEHFTRQEGLEVLQDCHRVLHDKGIIRISCPDLMAYAKAYVNNDSRFYDSVAIRSGCCYEGLTTYGDLFISKAYDNHNGHKWFYDAESTIKLLKEAGFKEVNQKSLHDSSLPNIELVEPPHRVYESFYVEARK